MMRCAQSLCMAVILRPQMRLSSWTSPKRTRASGGLTAGSCGPFLFGCNSTRPGPNEPPASAGTPRACLDVIHLQGAGLLWRISGGRIVAMGGDWAAFEINGAQRIIHRRPSPANFVLPWRRRVP